VSGETLGASGRWRTAVAQTESETGFIQFSGPFALFLPALAFITAVSAGFASWKNRKLLD
jgi:hypothetical protein